MQILNFFDFHRGRVAQDDVEQALDLAVLTAGFVHGRDRVRIEAYIDVDAAERLVTIDASTVAGRHLSRLFAGLLRTLHGANSFHVERVVVPDDDELACCGAACHGAPEVAR